MMLDELSLVLAKVSPNGKADSYVWAIVDENALGKPTQTTRQRTAKRLAELYSLDPNCTLFRLLRRYWPAGQAGRPLLALLAAADRDPCGGGIRRSLGVSLWCSREAAAGLDVDAVAGSVARRSDRPRDRSLPARLAQLQGGGERGGDHVPRLVEAAGRKGCP